MPKNNIGLLRLLFATLVIVGHAPEMTDNSSVREPLHLLGSQSIDLGTLSVIGFFLLSGYLITMSMDRSKDVSGFMLRRALRIYPAYLFAFVLCVFVMGPLVGANPADGGLGTLFRIAFLKQPQNYPGQLPGLNGNAVLDGPMWTLWHEFQCYLLVGFLGAFGWLKPRVVAGLTAISLLTAATSPMAFAGLHAFQSKWAWGLLISNTAEGEFPTAFLYLFAAFMVGSCFWMFRDKAALLMRPEPAIALSVAASASLLIGYSAGKIAFILLTAAPLFAIALRRYEPVAWLNDQWDISYGTYLYGWPIATYLRWVDPSISPWTLALITVPLAWLCGAASWWGLERWCKVTTKREKFLFRRDASLRRTRHRLKRPNVIR